MEDQKKKGTDQSFHVAASNYFPCRYDGGAESSTALCFLCKDFVPSRAAIQGAFCFHCYCRDCFSPYIVKKLQHDISDVKCTGGICWTVLGPDFCRPFIPEEVFSRWKNEVEKANLLREMEQAPSCSHCKACEWIWDLNIQHGSLLQKLSRGWEKIVRNLANLDIFDCPYRNCPGTCLFDDVCPELQCWKCRRDVCCWCQLPLHECLEFKSQKEELERERNLRARKRRLGRERSLRARTRRRSLRARKRSLSAEGPHG